MIAETVVSAIVYSCSGPAGASFHVIFAHFGPKLEFSQSSIVLTRALRATYFGVAKCFVICVESDCGAAQVSHCPLPQPSLLPPCPKVLVAFVRGLLDPSVFSSEANRPRVHDKHLTAVV